MKAINWRSLANKWNHLKGIDFSFIRTRLIIDVLNGTDDAGLHCSVQEMKRKPEEPFERLTPPGRANIGYINGSMWRSVQTNFIITYNTKETELQEINSTLETFLEIELVADNIGRITNKDDKDTLDLVSKSWKYENGKKQV